MITEKVKQYIDKNAVCAENIFHNWKGFLELLFAESGCVESILWFEYVLVTEQEKSLGGGGYIDKNNAKYMYAETYICHNDLKNKTLDKVEEYISSVISAHPNHKLIPSFDIV